MVLHDKLVTYFMTLHSQLPLKPLGRSASVSEGEKIFSLRAG